MHPVRYIVTSPNSTSRTVYADRRHAEAIAAANNFEYSAIGPWQVVAYRAIPSLMLGRSARPAATDLADHAQEEAEDALIEVTTPDGRDLSELLIGFLDKRDPAWMAAWHEFAAEHVAIELQERVEEAKADRAEAAQELPA